MGSGAAGVRCGARSRLEIRRARSQSAEPDGREGRRKEGSKQAKAETWSGGAVAMAKWWPGALVWWPLVGWGVSLWPQRVCSVACLSPGLLGLGWTCLVVVFVF